MENIRIKDILADEDQPRKYFNAVKMKSLADSIEREGIMSPLIVEDMGNGKYLLIDGERRFRAAIQVGLTTVPAVIEEQRDEKERKLRQFALQEQHEQWTPVEKAIALLGLSQSLNVSLIEVCKQVGMSKAETDRYVAFSNLTNKEAYLKSELPLDWVVPIRSVVAQARKLSLEVLEDPFTHSDERAVEKRLIGQIKIGVITKRQDLIHLKDAFMKNPKVIRKYLENDKTTPEGLFSETKAKGAFHLRNMLIHTAYATSHARRFLEIKDVKLNEDMVGRLKDGLQALDDLINLAE